MLDMVDEPLADVVRKWLRAVPDDLSLATFELAVNAAVADGRALDIEKVFAYRIAQALSISESDYAATIQRANMRLESQPEAERRAHDDGFKQFRSKPWRAEGSANAYEIGFFDGNLDYPRNPPLQPEFREHYDQGRRAGLTRSRAR